MKKINKKKIFFVSITFLIKTGKKKTNVLGHVYHFDLYGKRDIKYDFLIENSLKSTPYNELKLSEPNFFFKMKDYEEENIYKYRGAIR